MIVPIRPRKQENGLAPIFQQLAEQPQYPVSAVTAPPLEMGWVVGRDEQFCLSDAHLAVHMAVLGGSGSGKSKFLELMLQQRLLDGKAFGLWDPHGDLAKSLLALVAAQKAYGDDVLWRKVHYLELTVDSIFSFDLVARAPRRTDVGDYAYYQWLRVRVERVWKVIMRRVSEQDQDVMVRLK